jgi:osmotically-inducible protein OsmY
MKNIINFFAVTIFTAATLNAATTTTPAQGGIQVQIDQTKTGTPLLPNGQVDTKKIPADINKTDATKAIDINTPADTSTGHDFVTDHDLAKEIYRVIREDRTISGDSKIKILVTVYNGKVTLSGDAISDAEKARAELLANQANKLKSVTNNIRVVK